MMSNRIELDQESIRNQAHRVHSEHRHKAWTGVYGVPAGGAQPAAQVASLLGVPLVDQPVAGETLVIDDLVDTGETFNDLIYRFGLQSDQFEAFYRKPHSPADLAPNATEVDGWLVFPWEGEDEQQGPSRNVTRLLEFIGEDPTRSGLLDTPTRVVKALGELTAGYGSDPSEHLNVLFEAEGDPGSPVVVAGIEFTSLCEHHMLPFTGSATLAYIPNPEVGIVGLSKLPRMFHGYARRLQVQERLTKQAADAIEERLKPVGLAVIVTAEHSCMTIRGAHATGATTTTSVKDANGLFALALSEHSQRR